MSTSKPASAASRAAANEIGARDGAEFRADEDGGALFAAVLLAFHAVAFGANQVAGPGFERGEADAVFLVGLLDAGGLEVFEDHLDEVAFLAVFALVVFQRVDQFIVFVHIQHPVRGEAFHREGAGDADLALVLVGFVVEILLVGAGGDGGVDFLLALDAQFPEPLVQFPDAVSGQSSGNLRGTSHSWISGGTSAVYFCLLRYESSQSFASAFVSFLPQRLQLLP